MLCGDAEYNPFAWGSNPGTEPYSGSEGMTLMLSLLVRYWTTAAIPVRHPIGLQGIGPAATEYYSEPPTPRRRSDTGSH